MDWKSLYCPNRCCKDYGIPFKQGQMVKNGSSHGQKQALCRARGAYVSLKYGTTYLDLHADPAIFETAVGALAEGNSIRAAAHIVQVDKDTVCAWLDRAAQHCRLGASLKFMIYAAISRDVYSNGPTDRVEPDNVIGFD